MLRQFQVSLASRLPLISTSVNPTTTAQQLTRSGPPSPMASDAQVPGLSGERARGTVGSRLTYYNQVRTHLALDKGTPLGRVVQRSGVIIAIPILSGLHHHYVRICFSERTRGVVRPKSRLSPRCVTAGRTLERRHCLPGLHQHRVEVTAASALPADLHRQLDDRGGDLRQCLNA